MKWENGGIIAVPAPKPSPAFVPVAVPVLEHTPAPDATSTEVAATEAVAVSLSSAPVASASEAQPQPSLAGPAGSKPRGGQAVGGGGGNGRVTPERLNKLVHPGFSSCIIAAPRLHAGSIVEQVGSTFSLSLSFRHFSLLPLACGPCRLSRGTRTAMSYCATAFMTFPSLPSFRLPTGPPTA